MIFSNFGTLFSVISGSFIRGLQSHFGCMVVAKQTSKNRNFIPDYISHPNLSFFLDAFCTLSVWKTFKNAPSESTANVSHLQEILLVPAYQTDCSLNNWLKFEFVSFSKIFSFTYSLQQGLLHHGAVLLRGQLVANLRHTWGMEAETCNPPPKMMSAIF